MVEWQMRTLHSKIQNNKMESKKDSLSSCVRIVCRIRKPLESESGSKHLGKARTSGKVGLNPEFEYSVFTTSKESNLVLASETPVPGKLINATFKASTDLPTFVSNFDKKPTTFTFDYVAGDYVSQEGFYNQQVRGLVQSMIKGYSATILAYGPTGQFLVLITNIRNRSGKTYSLRGKTETERGCIVRSVQDLFSLIELAKEGKSDKKYSVGISIYHLYGEKIVDLLDSGAKKESLDVELIPESDSCERQIKGLSEYPLKSAMAINGYLERSDTLKKMQASEEQDKELSLKSHTSVLLKLYVSTKNDKQLLSQIQFIELAGSEQINLRHTLRKPLSEHFANLSIKLLKHSLGEIPESRDQLQKCLDLTMKPQAPVVLLCCVEPRREKLDQSIEALAYTTKIRTCILSAMARDSLGETASKWDKEILTEKDKEYVEHVKAATRNPFKEPKLSQTYGNVEIPRKEELSYTARGYDRSLIANKSSPEEARFEEDLKRIKRQVAEREREDAESFRGNGTIEPEQRYVERSSPEFLHSKREMAATLGEDARRIVDKYYGSGRSDEDEEEDEKVVEDYSKSLKKENDGVELKKKLVKIEEKSKTIAKSLKALLRGSGQAQTMQQFDSIYEETKGIYEEYIANLEDRVQRLEVGLEGTEKALQEKDQQYNDYVRNAKKKLKEKDLELADLLNQAESLENVANEAKNEVETCKNENEALIAEINSLKKKEIEKQEGSKKHKEIERLNNEVAELKQAFKEKKKENAKNKSTIRDMNKEITMLKQELADQTQQAKEAAEESRILKKQVEQEKQFSEEIKRKLEKAQSRKVVLQPQHVLYRTSTKTKLKDMQQKPNHQRQKCTDQKMTSTMQRRNQVSISKKHCHSSKEQKSKRLNWRNNANCLKHSWRKATAAMRCCRRKTLDLALCLSRKEMNWTLQSKSSTINIRRPMLLRQSSTHNMSRMQGEYRNWKKRQKG
eukprot:TRINITY_DN120185_c2_g1_i1.p1 TRINITY_DN120185_c2_g1~~TRINITY_DN120185_c2_g1_i1.p1  ORF type:complete len:966 (-),score=103.90 TRINITY_DN120185_c2_g1_i1:5423-8320(-)